MLSRLVRRLASHILVAAARLLPGRLLPWARAMERELADIEDDRAASVFAAGCIRAVLGLALAERLGAPRGAGRPIPLTNSAWSLFVMNRIASRPRLLGLICGAAAVGMGIAYMAAAGAPSRYLLVNLVALVLGASAWLALGRTAGGRLAGAGPTILALAFSLLMTAWFGVPVDGASRWLVLGTLSLQVSLIIVPVMVVLYARRPDAIGTAGMIVAALALALQPDRAMAAVLLVGLLALLLATGSRLAIVAAAASALAFGWALRMPDALPAVPYVDRILYTSFGVHPLAGSAVAVGTALLIVPALLGAWRGTCQRAVLFAFGGCWLGVVVAAALGNYPTPLVGYGGSAVLGYFLSVALLPNRVSGRRGSGAPGSRPIAKRGSERPSSELRAPYPV